MNREVILQALFAKLSAAANFSTASRRLKLWGSVAPADKPALFMMEHAEQYVHSSEATPQAVTLWVDVFIYTDAGNDQSVAPIAALNGLLDALDNALRPDALTGKQTLGGLVSHCWIEGKLLKDSGDLDGSGVAVVPVRILVP